MLPRMLLTIGTLTASEMLFHLTSIPFTITKEYRLLQKAQEQWERQRVSIARALLNKPKILFADEPTANLDRDSSRAIIDLFKTLNKEFKQTIIMVTHEIDEGEKADRIIWINDGLLDKNKSKDKTIKK